MALFSSITFIIPALNEEKNLANAVHTALEIAPQYFKDWEVLIFDDGSTDGTAKIANRMVKQSKKVKVIHHVTPHNLGGCYKEGIEMAQMDYVIMIPGDNECGPDMLHQIFSETDAADIIVPYTTNSEVRPLGRRVLSDAFTRVLNLISGTRLRYYNGTVLHKTSIIQSYPIKTDSFGYQAEALIMLLRKGHSYKEVPVLLHYRDEGKSKAMGLKNIAATLKFLGTFALQARKS